MRVHTAPVTIMILLVDMSDENLLEDCVYLLKTWLGRAYRGITYARVRAKMEDVIISPRVPVVHLVHSVSMSSISRSSSSPRSIQTFLEAWQLV
jgi:hypothetical protein